MIWKFVSEFCHSKNGLLLHKTTKTFVVKRTNQKMEEGRLQSCRFEGGWMVSIYGWSVFRIFSVCEPAWIWGKNVVARGSLWLGRLGRCMALLGILAACQFSRDRSIYLFIFFIPTGPWLTAPSPSKLEQLMPWDLGISTFELYVWKCFVSPSSYSRTLVCKDCHINFYISYYDLIIYLPLYIFWKNSTIIIINRKATAIVAISILCKCDSYECWNFEFWVIFFNFYNYYYYYYYYFTSFLDSEIFFLVVFDPLPINVLCRLVTISNLCKSESYD